jgi:hypothetical protein
MVIELMRESLLVPDRRIVTWASPYGVGRSATKETERHGAGRFLEAKVGDAVRNKVRTQTVKNFTLLPSICFQL